MFDNNIENFLKPIDSQMPCGIDLNVSDKLRELRDLRIELQQNETENNSEWNYKKKGATYLTLIEMCENILKSVSKDLMVCNYYIEALFKTYSIQGMLHGLKVYNALCDTYWENIYPELSTEDYDLRAMPFKLLQTDLYKLSSSYLLCEDKEEKILLTHFIDETNSTKLSILKNKIENYLSKIPKSELENKVNLFQEILECLEKTNDYLELIPVDDIDIFLCHKYLKKTLKLYQNSLDKQNDLLTAAKANSEQVVSNTNLNQEVKQTDNAFNIINQMTPKESHFLSLLNSETTPASYTTLSPENLYEIQIKSREDAYKMIEKSIQFLLKQDPQSLIPNMIQKNLSYRNLPIHKVFQELEEICNGKNSFVRLFENAENGN